MQLTDTLNNAHRICILGYGIEAKGALEYFAKFYENKALAVITNVDKLSDDDRRSITIEQKIELIDQDEMMYIPGDVTVTSPGFAPNHTLIATAYQNDIPVLGTLDIFLEHYKNQSIGITASKGKSTLASLAYTMLQNLSYDVYLLGNIGVSPLGFVARNAQSISKNTLFVVECSSYQLHYCTHSPHIALLHNLFPEHLDWHGSYENYSHDKMNILRFQKDGDLALVSKDISDSIPKTKAGVQIYGDTHTWHAQKDGVYKGISKYLDASEITLQGIHNYANIAAVCALLEYITGSADLANFRSLATFQGLSHRMQYVGEYDGIFAYDDAISTTPQSTMAAVQTLGDNLGAILLGGSDRGSDFTDLAAELSKIPTLDAIALFPESGRRIHDALQYAYGANNAPMPAIHNGKDMHDAIRFVFDHTKKGKVCLLSCASPSYSLWENYEHKAEEFINALRNSTEMGIFVT